MKTLPLVVCFFLVATASQAAEPDKRQVLLLTEAQRGIVLDEMRAMLTGTQGIVSALSKDDMAAVAKAARAIGMGMVHKTEDQLKGALPEAFMQLGSSAHQDFDRIADDAQTKKSSRHTLRQLSESMNKCIACHATYQIRTVRSPAKPKPQ